MELYSFTRDLDRVLDVTRSYWNDLRGGRLFITGGTGFFGRWLLESFHHANQRLGLGAKALVLTRDPVRIVSQCSWLSALGDVTLLQGDIRHFEFPDGEFTHVIHAATTSAVRLQPESAKNTYETIVDGTRRTLDFVNSHGRGRLLYVSSGAVYGHQPKDLAYFPESFQRGPDPTHLVSAYGEGKSAAERLCISENKINGSARALQSVIARCFAFAGPLLPLDQPYALANFIRDARQELPISISGDGSPLRSYLDTQELTTWLWTLLFAGRPGEAYNVGSQDGRSILEIAQIVQKYVSSRPVEIRVAKSRDPNLPIERYLPSVQKMADEFGLKPVFSIEDSVQRTLAALEARI